jgi:hypothetical protein
VEGIAYMGEIRYEHEVLFGNLERKKILCKNIDGRIILKSILKK